MSRLLSLRNVSKIKSRHVPVSNTCYNASSSSSSRLVTFGNSRIATGNAARNSSRFHTSSNSNASEKHLTAARLQLNLHSKPDEKGMPLLSELTAWVLQKVKVPKGELRVVVKEFVLFILHVNNYWPSLYVAISLAIGYKNWELIL